MVFHHDLCFYQLSPQPASFQFLYLLCVHEMRLFSPYCISFVGKYCRLFLIIKGLWLATRHGLPPSKTSFDNLPCIVPAAWFSYHFPFQKPFLLLQNSFGPRILFCVRQTNLKGSTLHELKGEVVVIVVILHAILLELAHDAKIGESSSMRL